MNRSISSEVASNKRHSFGFLTDYLSLPSFRYLQSLNQYTLSIFPSPILICLLTIRMLPLKMKDSCVCSPHEIFKIRTRMAELNKLQLNKNCMFLKLDMKLSYKFALKQPSLS